MTYTIIFIFLLTHWVADFIFQDEKWAISKSKNWVDLLMHTTLYSIIWLPVIYFITWDIKMAALFVQLTFIGHTATDYVTSKIVSKMFAAKHYGSPIPNLGGFTVIGFDQLLHYTQLGATWWLINNM